MRSRTFRATYRLTREERLVAALTVYPDDVQRPRTRGECVDGPRPCPWVSCRHHLYLDVSEIGTLRVNFPDRDVDELEESCSLDVAERDGVTLEGLGELMGGLTRERVRQMQEAAIVAAQEVGAAFGLLPGNDNREG